MAAKYPKNFVDDRNNLLNKVLNDQQLRRVAEAIGRNFELLAPELSINDAEMDRIKFDQPTAILRDTEMLKLWRTKKAHAATMSSLCEVLEKKKSVVTINKDILEEVISEMNVVDLR